MRKAISLVMVIVTLHFNLYCAFSENQSTSPSSIVSGYSFQKDYDAIEKVASSIFYCDIFDNKSECIGSASGFVAFHEHLFITNYHVIENAHFLRIWDESDNSYIIDNIIAVDKNNDLAILLFPEGNNYESLDYQIDTQLKRGQPVTTIGSPQGIQNTVAFGNISAFPIIEGKKMIQFTAPISHGSSGGVLFDDDGKVIGVTTALLSEGENIGFAVPIDNLLQLYDRWDKKSFSTESTPTPEPTNSPTPNPTKSPISSPTPDSPKYNSIEEFRKYLTESIIKETGISAMVGGTCQHIDEANNSLRIRFQVENIDSKRVIEAIELYVYATDVWGNKIYGKNDVYHWTTIKRIKPGEIEYSDYITIPKRNEIFEIFCGINKVKYSDGSIKTANKIEYSSWQISH